jgi:DNA-binding MarR family transcriptional regulator
MDEVFSNDVKQFISQHIHSVAQLEVLLTMQREPARQWSADEITSLLFLQPKMVTDLLRDLVGRGFVVQSGEKFHYQPVNSDVADLIDRLAKLYRERRVAVTTEIFSKPIDFVKAFADAFRLREEK